MRKADIEAVGELAGEALASGGTLIKDMHTGIAGRPFRILGPAAAPVRVIHDGVSRAVYRGVRGGLRAVAEGGARLAARRAPDDGPALISRGSYVVSALNGLYGDHLRAREDEAGGVMTAEAKPEIGDGARRSNGPARGLNRLGRCAA